MPVFIYILGGGVPLLPVGVPVRADPVMAAKVPIYDGFILFYTYKIKLFGCFRLFLGILKLFK